MAIILPCLLCRASLPSVAYEKHLRIVHKVSFNLSWIIRKTLKENSTTNEEHVGNDDFETVSMTQVDHKNSFIDEVKEDSTVYDDHEQSTHSDKLTKNQSENEKTEVFVKNEYIEDVLNTKFIDSSNSHVKTEAVLTYKCEICGKQFAKSYRLKRHSMIHVEEKPYKCETCGKQFSRSDGLKEHLITHSGEKPFICEVCEKHFFNSYRLKEHLMIHTGEKRYKCEECPKEFSRSQHLKKHLMTHSGKEIELFPCDMCDKSFKSQWYVKTHKKNHISVDKSFKCEECQKEFSISNSLKKHLITHSGIEKKPFHCGLCGKSFKTEWYVETHRKNHQSVDLNLKDEKP